MFRRMSMIALAVVLVLAFSGFALAQNDKPQVQINIQGQPQGNDAYDPALIHQYGYQQGYDNGFRHGEEARAQHLGFDFHSEDWEHANRGYIERMGPLDQFKKGYQDGYRKGYTVAFYDTIPVVPEKLFVLPPTMTDREVSLRYTRGYQDGMGQARRDAAKGKYNPNPRGGENRGAEYNAGYRVGYQAVYDRY